jgi:photosystem II stability/assembly factor-like uncharacterized protein
MLSASEGWAVGGGSEGSVILHYRNGMWSNATSPDAPTIALASVAMFPPSDGWAVGPRGTLLQYSGGSWSSGGQVSQEDQLHGVTLVSASEGWAVGTMADPLEITAAILHFTDGAWSEVSSPSDERLNSVAMASANDGWVVGANGTVLHDSGGSWSQVSSPTSEDLNAVAMVSASEGWTVGADGAIVHYRAGR